MKVLMSCAKAEDGSFRGAQQRGDTVPLHSSGGTHQGCVGTAVGVQLRGLWHSAAG